MRILVIAYEFPPSPSPQSLRWAYLCRELSLLGHEVHVLTVDLGGTTPGLPDLPAGIHQHRAFAGPLRGSLAVRRDWKQKRSAQQERTPVSRDKSQSQPLRPPRSWKQDVSEWLQKIAAWYWFPDIRGEWKPSAKRMLGRLLDAIQPDVVISSHEPATTLELGLIARKRGFPWLADLGDPVLAAYTPRRWMKRSLDLEKKVCLHADHLTVTNDRAAGLLSARHGRHDRISVITQGFDPGIHAQREQSPSADPSRLELLYTGSLYSFRKIDTLLDALEQHPAARLSIASIAVPESVLTRARRMPAQIRLLGFLPHRETLLRQRQADVLINIANEDPTQVPGKFYEYLGSGRPILQIGTEANATRDLLAQTGRGWQCDNTLADISSMLATLETEKRTSGLPSFAPDDEAIAQYGWPRLASQLEACLLTIAR